MTRFNVPREWSVNLLFYAALERRINPEEGFSEVMGGWRGAIAMEAEGIRMGQGGESRREFKSKVNHPTLARGGLGWGTLECSVGRNKSKSKIKIPTSANYGRYGAPGELANSPKVLMLYNWGDFSGADI